MIIKSIRVPCERTLQIAKYLSEPGANERVEWILGAPEIIRLMGEISKLAGKIFAVRHVIIAPQLQMDHHQLAQILREYCAEYRVPATCANRACVVRHVKARACSQVSKTHWHVAFPETDPETLRTLDSSFTKIRNEKLSRMSELLLEHPVVPGRFNKEVYDTLTHTRPELDLSPFRQALEAACVQAGLPNTNWVEFRRRISKSRDQCSRRGFPVSKDGVTPEPGFTSSSF